ncbi:MAG: hypothetical protein PHE48_02005 [Candidatus Daviesbacteria bacterium]|nr:hypothetical protein [Candidatus Daviesbacteria bacterium]
MVEVLRKKQKLIFVIFVFLIFMVSFLTFWRAFGFDFWGEDWEQIWYAVFSPSLINNQQIYPHPIVIYEELFLAKFLGFNTLYWQTIGYLLKVLGAFAVSLMMLGITRSKRVAIFTGLIYASSVGGLASVTWVAAQASALEIPFLCLGIYFWITKKNYVLALALLIFSIWADPSRGIFGCLIVILWDILTYIQNTNKVISIKPWKRVLILIIAIFFIKSFLLGQRFFEILPTLDVNINYIVNYPIEVLTNFLNTLGNLLVGWFISIPQNVFAVSIPTFIGIAAGYLFLFQTIFLLVYFLKKKNESFKILFIFSIWIVVFFLPNWLLADNSMIGSERRVLGQTHRYLTLSAVGLACFLGYALSRVKRNHLQGFLLLFVVGSNIVISNQILKKEAYYRSTEVTKPMWDKIEKDVPVGEENSLFFIRGEDKFRVNDISQIKIPFAIRRGIISRDKWPGSTSDPGVVKRYMCGNTDDRRIVPLSRLHVWYIKGNTLDNISEKVRKEFSEMDCSSQ